jgi:hypothetical protein
VSVQVINGDSKLARLAGGACPSKRYIIVLCKVETRASHNGMKMPRHGTRAHNRIRTLDNDGLAAWHAKECMSRLQESHSSHQYPNLGQFRRIAAELHHGEFCWVGTDLYGRR